MVIIFFFFHVYATCIQDCRVAVEGGISAQEYNTSISEISLSENKNE